MVIGQAASSRNCMHIHEANSERSPTFAVLIQITDYIVIEDYRKLENVSHFKSVDNQWTRTYLGAISYSHVFTIFNMFP